MVDSHTAGVPDVSLDQLIALNDEIAALIRAGVPLEQGLGELGGDMPGRLGECTTRLADRMRQGIPLDQALGEPGCRLPTIYRAVVESGMRSGRLAGALESVATSARRLAETRRIVASAAVYPLIVFLVGWVLFVLFVTLLTPIMAEALDEFQIPGGNLLRFLNSWGTTAYLWGPIVPGLAILMSLAWWYRSGRADMLQTQGSCLPCVRIPWIGKLIELSRSATFAEVLALLVENQVPLEEGVILAAESSGDRRLLEAAREMSASIRRGEMPDEDDGDGPRFPPQLQWLISAGQRRGELSRALRHGAMTYHRRAVHQAVMARVFIPILMTLVIGGSVTFGYALLVFSPWIAILNTLAQP